MEPGSLKELRGYIKELKELTISFSGGVDSSLLAKVAFDELGKKATAITVASEFTCEDEIINSINIAKEIGIKHKIIKINILDEELEKNCKERCYHCKIRILTAIEGKTIAEGTNADDIFETRPGMKALEELEVLSPLKECGLGKEKIRKLAKELGLSNYNKPSNSCLATRIPFNSKITKEKLEKIETAEKILKEKKITGARARLNDDTFLIELPSTEIEKYNDSRKNIEDKIYKLNIKKIKLGERK
ncbi:MAG: ATP-dependent sacrificial sulfur transferase LarE [Candidatus Nanoarchaeia archaeon]